ncbi:hypothetical protein ACFT4A_30335 [Streptomyces sp. NPDC057099]|uniref:hypothetical protein n=1 Tax=Streptomyces sp. NPDC057099 TaxID=3346019 RepID=UPI00363FB69A
MGASLLTGALLSAGLITAPSASAAVYCPGDPDQTSESFRRIALPNKPDMNVLVLNCFYNERGWYQATQVINWASTTGGNGFGKKFNYFRGTVWAQKNDRNKCGDTRSPMVNANASGSYIHYCTWDHANTSGMSADGKIVYDIKNDGEGKKVWQLNGTS